MNPDQPKKISVALITEDVGHLTGGRYYAWFLACALVELGYKVTVYTNRSPVFKSYFELYKQPSVQIVAENAKQLQRIDVVADIYIGSPINGIVAASLLGAKYHKPSYALIFDSHPFMAQYLGEAQYEGWLPVIKLLSESDTNIIALAKVQVPYICKWLNKRNNQVHVVRPCINSRAILVDYSPVRGDYLVFISRLVRHKHFEQVLQICRNLKIKLKVISSVDGEANGQGLVSQMGLGDQVEFFWRCGEEEKFKIIRGSKGVINASYFEGWGMFVTEAIAVGTPFIGYDLPTYREIQELAQADNLYLAKWKDVKDLEEKTKLCLSEGKFY